MKNISNSVLNMTYPGIIWINQYERLWHLLPDFIFFSIHPSFHFTDKLRRAWWCLSSFKCHHDDIHKMIYKNTVRQVNDLILLYFEYRQLRWKNETHQIIGHRNYKTGSHLQKDKTDHIINCTWWHSASNNNSSLEGWAEYARCVKLKMKSYICNHFTD